METTLESESTVIQIEESRSQGEEKKEKLISAESVRKHNIPEDCWLVIDGQVWDFSDFAPEHPGGTESAFLSASSSSPSHKTKTNQVITIVILKHAGRDATTAYNSIHAPSLVSKTLSKDKYIGRLDPSTVTDEWLKPPPSASKELAHNEKPPLHTLISSHDFESVAKKTISKKAWAFYSSAATDCITRRGNREYFDRVWFRPRVLRNVRTVSSRTSILGVETDCPFFVSPAAMARLVDPEGEKAIARACRTEGIIQCVCTQVSTTPLAPSPCFHGK